MKTYSLRKKVISGLMAILVGLVMMPSMKVNAKQETYTVTFRPGNVGTFDRDAVATFYGSDVEFTAHGAIKFTVNAGDAMPAVYSIVDPDAGYFEKTWGPTAEETTVTKNVDYVVDYGRLVDGVEFTIKYVDSVSGESVAPFETAYANNGEPITRKAPTSIKTSGSFKLDTTKSAEEQTIVLDKTKENNEIIFYYVSDLEGETEVREVIEYVDGGTTTVTETNVTTIDNGTTTVAGAVDIGGGGAGGGADTPDDQEVVNIDDEDTPLADATPEEPAVEEKEQGGSVVVIDDEETALSNFEENGMNPAVLWAVVVGVAAAALTVVWLMSKRKKAANEDSDD